MLDIELQIWIYFFCGTPCSTNNMKTHKISNGFFKQKHGKSKFKIPKVKKEEESVRLNAKEPKKT